MLAQKDGLQELLPGSKLGNTVALVSWEGGGGRAAVSRPLATKGGNKARVSWGGGGGLGWRGGGGRKSTGPGFLIFFGLLGLAFKALLSHLCCPPFPHAATSSLTPQAVPISPGSIPSPDLWPFCPSCRDWPPAPSEASPTRSVCHRFIHPALRADPPLPGAAEAEETHITGDLGVAFGSLGELQAGKEPWSGTHGSQNTLEVK